MRLGVIVRGEDRGIGIQTWEVCRHLEPWRVIFVDMGTLSGSFAVHRDRFEHWQMSEVRHDQMGDPAVIAPIVRGLDVVYFVETPYRWEFCEIARLNHCATVCHLNPEFYGHWQDPQPRPSQWWLPSSWLRNDPRLPADAIRMPMPCPTDRFTTTSSVYRGDRPLKILHVAGHAAMGDRNGTRSLLATLPLVTADVEVTVTTQDRHMPSPTRLPRNVSYRFSGGAKNYWDLYDGYDVIVLPRRYGGLCLPAIEAAGAGLAIVMTDCPPNTDYPALLVTAHPGAPLEGKFGEIPTFTVDARALAAQIDHLAMTPSEVALWQRESRLWAADMSWDQWALSWRQTLGAVQP